MSLLQNKAWIWLLLPASAAAFFFGASLFFYHGGYSPPSTAELNPEQFSLSTLSTGRFEDARSDRDGVFLIDNAHGNAFTETQIDALLAKVADRGYSIEFVGDRDARFSDFSRLLALEERLTRASSYTTILPVTPFAIEEIDVLRRFVNKGGRILLIGDPARPSEINSVADQFGMVFQPGYLYNLVEHDLNFRNVIVRSFRQDQLTEGLEEIVVYTAGSIRSNGIPLAITDSNTFSSMVERTSPFTPIVRSSDGLVAAISDLTFLEPPQNNVVDNDRLISNIAEFLTTAPRRFDLTDFPHFLSGTVDILMGRSDLFEAGATMRDLLFDNSVAAGIGTLESAERDMVFVGLYDDAQEVAHYLNLAGVQVINETIRSLSMREVSTPGTALLSLYESAGRHVLVILADSDSDLDEILDQLDSGDFKNGLATGTFGIYKVSEPNVSTPTPTATPAAETNAPVIDNCFEQGPRPVC